VDDVARGLAAMSGRPELLLPPSIPTPRIGVVTQDFAGAPEASGGEALRIAARAAEKAGASVRALDLPEIIAKAWQAHSVIQEFEAHQALAWEYRENYDAMAPLLRARLDESRGLTRADYDAAIGVASRARHALAKVKTSTCC
jgi:Asp-tRNA(Asn)/Glu-tRNA(Gln) amidotransferase A subunit family amidase